MIIGLDWLLAILALSFNICIGSATYVKYSRYTVFLCMSMVAVFRPKPIVFKNFLIILSSTSQRFYLLFFFI